MNMSGGLPSGLTQSHRSWIQAVNQTDLDAYAGLVCEDVVWLPPGQAAFQGRTEFRSWLEPFFEQYAYEFTIDEPNFRMAGDWAVEKGSFRSLMTQRSSAKAMEHSGRFIILWRKDDDSVWRIERYVDDTPGRAAGS